MTDSPTFSETFTVTADNPLLHGHVVHGRNVLPGVGYVDLVLQVLARHGRAMREVELRNLTILAPLVVAPGDPVLVTVAGQPVAGGGWRIKVGSRRRNKDGDEELLHAWVTAAECAPTAFQERLELPLTGADRLTTLFDLYAWLRGRELVHSGLMKIDGEIHRRDQDWVAELELTAEQLTTADRFLFHPALFEAGLLSGSVGLHMLHEGSESDQLYLPLVFESFRAAGPLGRRCYVRVPAGSADRDDELMRLSVEFYDETGLKVAEVGRLTAKRVRAVAALDVRAEPTPHAATTGAEPKPAVGPSAATTVAAQDVLGILRELVAARLEIPVAQVDVDGGFYDLGLGSADLVSIVPELEERLSLPLSPTIMFEHRSIALLAAALREELAAAGLGQPDTAAPEAPAVTRAALVDEVSALLRVPAGEVRPDSEFREFGFDRTGLARLVVRLNERFGLALTPAVVTEYPTVQALAEYLAAAGHESAPASTGPARESADRPHPLLQRELRDGAAVAYLTRFDGSEPFLRDHQVGGSRVLPAVVQLELARAAVQGALGRRHPGRVRLDDIVWLRQASCGQDGLELRVDVRPLAGDSWDYSIQYLGADGAFVLCSQGRASLSEDGDRDLPRLDELRAACTEQVIPATDLYQLYERVGMDYGPAQRSLVTVGLGTDESGRPQALAELRRPAAADGSDDWLLHPSILDGALQAIVGLRLNSGQEARPALPFAVRHVECAATTPVTAYAWIRHQGAGDPDSPKARVDVTVFDQEGRVCADLTGLSTRILGDAPQPAPAPVPAAESVGNDIAIVGISGRYPEAEDLDEFWQNLRSGRDCIREVPAERWDHRRYADVEGSSSGRWGGFIDGIDRFDSLFFQISPHEAELLDPQERVFVECAHHALEDAGYTGELLARAAAEPGGRAAAVAPPGKVGVFVGAMYQEYQLYGAQAQERGQAVTLSSSASGIANRVSYSYGFTGPSMTVDTMCSSSLTAIHLACEAIKSGQCEMALAGGVNLHSHPNKFLMLSQRRYLSADGRCRSFGEGGTGYVPGEGVGVLVLKSLARAIADGDHVYGVIKGTALGHGGRAPGYSVPSPAAQGEVITEALTAAGVDPRSVSYLEAHGTGTSLGDPLEIKGLTKAFQAEGGPPLRIAVGSVKSNIGHCEGAAGIAGVTKVLLQLQHGELVPSLHSGTLNPHIDFDRAPVRVQRELAPWPRPTLEIDGERRTFPRIAGVSAFGAGGSNAHVVIAEFRPEQRDSRPAPPAPAGRPALLVLSAQSEGQLVQQAERLSARLAQLAETDLPDVAWTLQIGRMTLDERLAFAATSLADARAQLAAFAADPQRPGSWLRGTAHPGRRAPDATAEQALRGAAADWTDRGEYDALLRLWVDGATVDWETVYPTAVPARRISLPGYPFARDRCWYDLDLGDEAAEPLPPVADLGVVREQATAEAAAPVSVPESDGAAEPGEMLLLRPGWVAREGEPAGGAGEFAGRHVVVLGRLGAGEREGLRAGLPVGVSCDFVEVGEGRLEGLYGEVVRRVFTLLREVLLGGVRRPVLVQVVLVGAVGTDSERERLACLGGVAGLLKSARQENPFLRAQYVECLDGVPVSVVAGRLEHEAALDTEPEVRYRDGRRLVARSARKALADVGSGASPWEEGGVYLITGGAGGLGRIVAAEIAASVGHATVVLTGRSPLDEHKLRELNALRARGLVVDYRQADVADREAVARLFDDIADSHGPLTGIVHSAGVVADNYLIRKDPEELARVLAPKVQGLVNLDELSRELPLKSFVCFSSVTGAFGNAGQGDYAAANAFMDAYAAYRDQLVRAGVRSGTTVCVNWPLWDEGGIGGRAVRDRLRTLGLAPLDTPRGLTALRHAMTPENTSTTRSTLTVLVGSPDALAAFPVTDESQQAPIERSEMPEHDTAQSLEDPAVDHLRRLLAGALKLAPERLSPEAPLERYGMDSVIAVSVIAELEKTFGPLPRTLLFEVETVRELARYLAADHPQALRALLGEPAAPRPSALPEPSAPAPIPAPVPAERVAYAEDAEDIERRPCREEDIAVIGVTGRYPQAEDLEALWANLRAGKDCVTEPPADRWDGTTGAWGGFLDGIDRFDSLFFGISPREAAAMDPQQRLMLETVWQLLEQSGVTQDTVERRYRRRVGVYVGAAYQLHRADESDPALAAVTEATSYSMIANRVSQFFGFEGPSLALDSMCTSSTLAVHLACADLQRGESELAVAAGINLTVHPAKYRALAEMQLLGSHPGSRSFRDGDGFLPSEGVGAVLLKPLSAALRDGDTVHAVIKGTASLHSGRSNGFMKPSYQAQVSVMRRALEKAEVEADTIGYVEAAANGTPLSDEVELRALREVFRGVSEPVALGSVKSNLGHPEAVSGIAQLTKVILQLRHQELAPLVAAGAPNPNLDFEGTALRLCEEQETWQTRATTARQGAPAPRRALINSVAAGGSLASLVVEAPPAVEAPAADPDEVGPHLVLLSARTPQRLRIAAERLHAYLEADSEVSLADVAYTSQLGREAQPERLAVVADSVAQLRQALTRYLAEGSADAAAAAGGGPSAAPFHLGNAEQGAGPLGSVLTGPSGEAFLAGLVSDRNHEHIAEMWVRGIDIPWQGLHRAPRRVVSLPPTWFEPARHWVGRPAGLRAPATAEALTERPVTAEADQPGEPAPARPGENGAAGTKQPPARALTDTERFLVESWSELLQIDAELIDDSSDFLTLGGNSLLATRLMNLVKERTGMELPGHVVFAASRLSELATTLEAYIPASADAFAAEQSIADQIALVENMSADELDALLDSGN
ncbi:SDR family NAD(P)-dependent oxidoreductase [Streptomyces sp. NEAU-sy36]|uniref:SDR family NAD(P)-dependent oxidoreductase n=1 Tax=unclassified Streptomyces TaxID=2593676 RepID=UPI0015D63A38|nr:MULTISPECIES: SDR family NAD(P)-dependent oxidoreductase [unclassified Streptomyces]QLJ03665.1 SDR family NAD(P)-dependent oxidoreductase [Streptomyces sp. NEAU-sy36]